MTGKRPRKTAGAPSVVIVAAKFHAAVEAALVEGAVRTLTKGGIARARIRVVSVPGSFELPAAAACAAEALRPQAIIAIGCLIEGDTPQYAAIGQAVYEGLIDVSVRTRIPVTCGVVMAHSLAQARARAGGSMGNRGTEAAEAALAMMQICHTMRSSHA